jgi:hypothetical protein
MVMIKIIIANSHDDLRAYLTTDDGREAKLIVVETNSNQYTVVKNAISINNEVITRDNLIGYINQLIPAIE